jgi:hypothetical protein
MIMKINEVEDDSVERSPKITNFSKLIMQWERKPKLQNSFVELKI